MQDRRGASFVNGCETAPPQEGGRRESLLRRCGCGELTQGVRGGADGDALILTEDEQVPLVSGDDELSLSGNRAGEDVIVVGIAAYRRGEVTVLSRPS
jgi:hypothetical protein